MHTKATNTFAVRHGSPRKASYNRIGLTAAALVCAALLSAACARESPSERAAAVGGVTAAQVIENPAAYVGKTVTVSGDVEEVHSPRAFNMDSGTSVGELLVLGREPFPQIPDAGNRAYVVNDTATVTGTIRMLVAAEIEREIGWDLTPELEAEFRAKPVLIAQQVGFRPTARSNAANNTTNTTNSNGTMNSGDPGAMNNSNMNAAGAAAAGMSGAGMNNAGMNNAGTGNANTANMNAANSGSPVTTVSELRAAPNKQALVGRPVQIENVNVQSVPSDRGFWINDPQGRIFARLDDSLNQGSAEWDVVIRPGQTRSLRGVVRELPSMDVIRSWNLMNAAETQELQDRGYYIHVTQLRETRRPVGQ